MGSELALIPAALLLGMIVGWKARGYLQDALVTVVWRLIVSETGKEKCLHLIARAIEKAKTHAD